MTAPSNAPASPASDDSPDAQTGSSAAPLRPPLLHSSELMQGHRSIEIIHNGEIYRLQSTRTGKLILTK